MAVRKSKIRNFSWFIRNRKFFTVALLKRLFILYIESEHYLLCICKEKMYVFADLPDVLSPQITKRLGPKWFAICETYLRTVNFCRDLVVFQNLYFYTRTKTIISGLLHLMKEWTGDASPLMFFLERGILIVKDKICRFIFLIILHYTSIQAHDIT